MSSRFQTRILIAEDHPIMRLGLEKELIDLGYNVIGSLSDGVEALSHIISTKPDVAILDIEMPLMTGFEVIEKLLDNKVNTRFIVITYHKKNTYLLKANKLNVMGYLLKDDTTKTIDDCIQSIITGNKFYSPSFKIAPDEIINSELQKIHLLTPSERTILRLIANNLSTAEIADELSISARTIEKHRSNIISKLELNANNESLPEWTKEHKEIIMGL